MLGAFVRGGAPVAVIGLAVACGRSHLDGNDPLGRLGPVGGSAGRSPTPSGGRLGAGGMASFAGSAGFATGGFGGGIGGVGGGDAGGRGGTPAVVCGNGRIDPGELCDDGNTEPSDGCGNDCRTARCLVPVTHATIQIAHDDTSCATVWVTPGSYAESLILSRDVVIEGTAPSSVIVHGSNRGRVVHVQSGSVELRNLAITDGFSRSGASGIYNEGDLTLVDCEVRDNLSNGASLTGAGLYTSGPLVLRGSQVHHNLARASEPDSTGTYVARGAGIYVATGGSLALLAGSSVSTNNARASVEIPFASVPRLAQGGGIYAEGNVQVTSSAVFDNEAHAEPASGIANASGGGVFLRAGTLTSDAGTFTSNHAFASGSAATAAGGAVALGDRASAIFRADSEIRGNEAFAESDSAPRATGGGIQVQAAPLSSVALRGFRAIFESNHVIAVGSGGVALGGAVHASASAEPTRLEFIESAFRANSADASGDAARAEGGSLFLSASTLGSELFLRFERSAASSNGVSAELARGGFASLLAEGAGTVRVHVTNSTVSHNETEGVGVIAADSGGGAFAAHRSDIGATIDLRFSSATLTDNAAFGGTGSAVRLDGVPGSPLELAFAQNSVFYEVAPQDGLCSVFDAVFQTGGYNLVGADSVCALSGNTAFDVRPTNPEFETLSVDRGLTETVGFPFGAPATDAGHPTACTDPNGNVLSTDQRGEPRHAFGRCDIGAFEAQF